MIKGGAGIYTYHPGIITNHNTIEYTRESNGMRSLLHIAAENNNWEIFSHLFDLKKSDEKIRLDYDNHASSANCQSFLVHLAKADQLHLLQKLFEEGGVHPRVINHM